MDIRKQGKKGRVVTSCSECHRRKQKCDRQKPCNVCLARDIPKSCIYNGSTVPIQHHTSTLSTNKVVGKAEIPASQNSSENAEVISPLIHNNIFGDLKNLLDKDNFFHAATSNQKHSHLSDTSKSKYLALVQQLPSEKIIRELIAVYFSQVDWFYPVLDPLSIDKLLVQWFTSYHNETLFSSLSCTSTTLHFFPALLFQIVALGLQFVQPDAEVFYQLGLPNETTCDRLSRQYSDISMEIMFLQGRHNPTIEGVQADFLRAFWLKNCSRGVESWHSLGDALRQAQELRLHRTQECYQIATEYMPDPNRHLEYTRRLWNVLFCWDSTMGWLLGRPRRINADDCDAEVPLGCMPLTSSNDTIVSRTLGDSSEPFSFSSNLYQYAVAQVIHKMRDMGADKPSLVDYNVVWVFHEQILSIVKQLPDVLRPDNPDKSWDERIPRLAKQRDQLWGLANAVLMILHRPHMIKHFESRQVVVESTLIVLDAHQRLFEKTSKHLYKMFYLTFFTIDASIMLSAVAVMYPPKAPKVEKRIEDALQTALVRLKLMDASNPTARSGFLIVKRCYEKIQEAKRASLAERESLALQKDSVSPQAFSHSVWDQSTLDPSKDCSYPIGTYSVALFDHPNDNTFDTSFWLEQLGQIPDLVMDDGTGEQTWDSLLFDQFSRLIQ